MPKLVKRMPRFARRPARAINPASEIPLMPPGFAAALSAPAVSGVTVTPQSALTFSAFFAAVRVITEDLASLPLAMFRKLPGGGRELIENHPVTYFFNRSPDNECTDMNWRESWYHHSLCWGNGYAEIDWSGQGQPLGLYLVHPATVLLQRNEATGKLVYRVQGASEGLPAWKMLHLAMLGFNGLSGYSIVGLMHEAIGMGKAMERYGGSFFGSGAMPGGVIEFARAMKPEALKNFRDSWNAIHGGPGGHHTVALLEEGAKYNSTQMSPEDAQLIMGRAFQVIEMCRVLRLPPNKLADYTNSHLANLEAANEDYIASCLRPMALRVEKSVNFKLLTTDEWRAGYYCKHDFRAILLRTAKDKADYYQKLFQIGYYNVDEIRALEGDNPIGEAAGGVKRFVMANLVDLTKAGDPPPKGQAPDPAGEPGRPARFALSVLPGEPGQPPGYQGRPSITINGVPQ